MKLPRLEIAPGVHVSCLATDKFKMNSLIVNVELPLDIENVTLANLTARVLKRGTAKYPDIKSMTEHLDGLYAAEFSAAVSRSGESQYLCFFTDFLVEKYTEGCDIIKEITALLGELLFNPLVRDGGFDSDYVKSEKKNLADNIDALINNKAAYAKFRCTKEMCKDEAYSLPSLGNKEILEKIEPKELYKFYTDALRENRIEFLYTGDGEYFNKVHSFLCEIFKNRERNIKTRENTCFIKRSADSFREVSEDMRVNQGKLSIGMRTGITNKDSDIAALIVANELFGGSPNSKLFMNVREKMSLCYYCSSGIDAVKGLMFVNAGIETENFEIAKKAILEQLDAVKNGDFTDEEFTGAVSSLVNGYKSVSDSVTSLETWYMSRIFRNEEDTPESRIEQILKVTPDEVKAAANKISPEVVFFLRGTLKEDGSDE